MDYHGLSRIIMNYPGLSWIIMDYHGLSWIIMDYHRLSWIIMDYHGLSWIITDYHGLSWNIMASVWAVGPRAEYVHAEAMRKPCGSHAESMRDLRGTLRQASGRGQPPNSVARTCRYVATFFTIPLSWIYHGLSWVIMDHLGLSWIIMEYH